MSSDMPRHAEAEVPDSDMFEADSHKPKRSRPAGTSPIGGPFSHHYNNNNDTSRVSSADAKATEDAMNVDSRNGEQRDTTRDTPSSTPASALGGLAMPHGNPALAPTTTKATPLGISKSTSTGSSLPPTQTSDEFTWPPELVPFLISHMKRNWSTFHQSYHKGKFWSHVQDAMIAAGHRPPAEPGKISAKWKKLVQKFKEEQENAGRNEGYTISWKWHSQMKEILDLPKEQGRSGSTQTLRSRPRSGSGSGAGLTQGKMTLTGPSAVHGATKSAMDQCRMSYNRNRELYPGHPGHPDSRNYQHVSPQYSSSTFSRSYGVRSQQNTFQYGNYQGSDSSPRHGPIAHMTTSRHSHPPPNHPKSQIGAAGSLNLAPKRTSPSSSSSSSAEGVSCGSKIRQHASAPGLLSGTATDVSPLLHRQSPRYPPFRPDQAPMDPRYEEEALPPSSRNPHSPHHALAPRPSNYVQYGEHAGSNSLARSGQPRTPTAPYTSKGGMSPCTSSYSIVSAKCRSLYAQRENTSGSTTFKNPQGSIPGSTRWSNSSTLASGFGLPSRSHSHATALHGSDYQESGRDREYMHSREADYSVAPGQEDGLAYYEGDSLMRQRIVDSQHRDDSDNPRYYSSDRDRNDHNGTSAAAPRGGNSGSGSSASPMAVESQVPAALSAFIESRWREIELKLRELSNLHMQLSDRFAVSNESLGLKHVKAMEKLQMQVSMLETQVEAKLSRTLQGLEQIERRLDVIEGKVGRPQ